MTITYPSYEETQERSRARLAAAKTPLIDALKALGICKVIVDYDGEGDSGQINDIAAIDADEESVSLADEIPPSLTLDWYKPNGDTLEAFIESYAWDALGLYHDYFEIDAGGYGTLTIEVGEGVVRIDHNARITDVVATETEL